jgi:SAM-dependent methyltransferase
MPDRQLEPEWLDSLAPSDPRARRARRELGFVNFMMGNARFVAEALAPVVVHPPEPPARIADLGAGDGRFMRDVTRRIGAPLAITLVDRQDAVAAETLLQLREQRCDARVAVADALAWLESAPPFDAIVANLFLHHLEPAALERLLERVAARTRLFVACEPRRTRVALAASRALGFVGCAAVSRHDAVASVRAGFAGRELSLAWRDSTGWRLNEAPRGLFSHVFIARRAIV